MKIGKSGVKLTSFPHYFIKYVQLGINLLFTVLLIPRIIRGLVTPS